MRYQSPDVSQHHDVLKRLVTDFIKEASKNPDYNTVNVVHDCVVYVMRNKPPEVERVDGAVIQPIIHEVVLGMVGKKKATKVTAPAAPERASTWLERMAWGFVAAARRIVG
jgi:hypothetical protein